MECINCHKEISEQAKFCPYCQAQQVANVSKEDQDMALFSQPVYPINETMAEPHAEPAIGDSFDPDSVGLKCGEPASEQAPKREEDVLPAEYKPLGAWGYFWLGVLFSIPVIGWIFLIVFTFHPGNINRRNYARSYWCKCFVVLALIGLAIGILAIITKGAGVSTFFENVWNQLQSIPKLFNL